MRMRTIIPTAVLVGGRDQRSCRNVSISPNKQATDHRTCHTARAHPAWAATNALIPVVKPMLKDAKNKEPRSTPARSRHHPRYGKRCCRHAFNADFPSASPHWRPVRPACMAMPGRVKLKNKVSAAMIAAPRMTIQINCGETAKACNHQPFGIEQRRIT